MAESYAIPGQTCDVGTIKAKFPALDDTRGWNEFCDCMFLEPTLREQIFVDGQLIPPMVLNPLSKPQREELVKRLAAQKKAQNPALGVVVVKEEVVLARSENWSKCVSNFCAVPWGCPHPTIPGFTMPFNMSPAAGSPPWTEFGAAARGIPKRNAGVFYTVGQIITVDLKDYAPLNLWRNMFVNPALFNLHILKLGLIPGIGPALVANLNSLASFTPEFGIPINKNIPLLLPFALAQCAAEQKSVVDYIVKPAVTGGAKSVALLLQLAGPALGQQYFAVAGILLEKFAKDQIESGEINKVLDPFANGTIRFFAESGSRIGSELQAAVGSGFDLKGAPGILRAFETGFRTVARSPEVKDDLARAILNTTADVMRIIAIVADGLGPKYPSLQPLDKAFAIADDVIYELFGFRLEELKRAVQQGSGEVNRLLETARRKGKSGTIEGLSESLNAITKAFDQVVKVLNEISNKLDGALDKFNAQFVDFNRVLTSVRSDTQAAFAATAANKTAALTSTTTPPVTVGPAVGLGSGGRAGLVQNLMNVRTGQVLPGTSVSAKTPAPAPAKAGGGTALLATAGLGFAVAGPPGALVGAGVGALLGSKKK